MEEANASNDVNSIFMRGHDTNTSIAAHIGTPWISGVMIGVIIFYGTGSPGFMRPFSVAIQAVKVVINT